MLYIGWLDLKIVDYFCRVIKIIDVMEIVLILVKVKRVNKVEVIKNDFC